MASQVSTGSPRMSRRATPSTKHTNDGFNDNRTPSNTIKNKSNSATPVAVKTNISGNIPNKEHASDSVDTTQDVSNILKQLRINDARKPDPTQIKPHDQLDQAIANLKDQHNTLKRQEMELRDDSDAASYQDRDRSSGSDLFTPATEVFDSVVHETHEKHPSQGTTEMARIRQELLAAKATINRQKMELDESQNLRHTMEQAMGPASEADFPLHSGPIRSPIRGPINQSQSGFNVSARPFTSRVEPSWQMLDDGKADLATTLVNSNMSRNRNWNAGHPSMINTIPGGYQGAAYIPRREARANSLNYGTNVPQTSPIEINPQAGRTFSSGSANIAHGIDDRMFNHFGTGLPQAGLRRSGNQMRTNSTISDPLSPISPLNTYSQTLVDTGVFPHIPGQGHFGFNDRGFGGQISPIGGQFPTIPGGGFASDLNLGVNALNAQNYVMPAEPMNYRRLLDKSVSCDWKYIVDKIVCNNDQQASIFLQQKLKVGTAEQKYEIVESIVNQAYPLMINRFGNFLVQRCFEHGTPDQVVAIANSIHGNVISLSMDAFGCHVIQKAFDSVPEDHKADMVRELLRRIPDTVTHRYACHVWQKLFELRWSSEPPQIMVMVNEALQGMWHEVALGETGSLVVQNIFENCVEEEKRPAIEEVISNIDLIAHGQFGNWCIQHLCEHGSPPDKRRVIDHILTNSYNYSIDQFASKVVEKCLKIGGSEFLERYLGVITTARPDRPRIPLIDIAGDQYGNYLIQWILVNTHQHQREQVAIHIRKHMVSLRGSKFGSRVAMLCSNPASVTRPGTASALVNPYGAPTQQRMGGRYR